MELVDKEIKIWWISGVAVLIIFGLWYLISPESVKVVFNHPFWDPTASRTIGAIYISWAIIGLMLYKALDNWDKIESWVIFGTISNGIGVILGIINIVLYTISILSAIVSLIIHIFFTVLGIHILMQKRE